ncbi:MAG TPA: Ku protein [Thermoanaerobaculia bacterium]|nr:Ku protein [Thermoanaerobaculia bacterium]
MAANVDELPDDEEGGSPGGRPFWSGTISFGLVNIPVALYAANRPRGRTPLHMVTEEGTQLERRYFCPEEDVELSWDELVRGYEIEKGKYVVVTDDELEAIEPRKTRDIDLRLFVDIDEIDPALFNRAYVLTPATGSNKAYRLLASVMEKTNRAGVATFVMRSKEYLVAILAENGIMRAETLRFTNELRKPEDVGLPKVKKAKPAEVKKFEQAITRKTKKVDFHEFLDDAEDRLAALAKRKQKKHEAVVRVTPQESERDEGGGEVIDLLEVLSRSLGGGSGAKKPARKAPAKKKATTAAKKK